MNQNSKSITTTTTTVSAVETEAMGESIGRQLKGGEVIVLSSDLGGGKTTFVRGLARGAGSADHVASPTFTISKMYKVPRGMEIHHFDFYRLQEAGIMRDELAELVADPKVVVVVEWSDLVENVLPDERLTIRLSSVAESETTRTVTITSPASLAYLTEGLER